MVTWVTPRTWVTLDQITATRLNSELRDQLSFLKTPPRSVVTIRNATNITTASTSVTQVDDAQFTLQLTTFGGDVRVWFLGQILNASASVARLDVLMDGTTYLSSGTGTPLTSGMLQMTIAAGFGNNGAFTFLVQNLPAGTHDFKLRWWVSAGTLTLVMAQQAVQFGAIEC